MLRLIILIIGQSILLVTAQTFLKIAVQHFGKFNWSWQYFKSVFTTWQFGISSFCFTRHADMDVCTKIL